MTRYGSADVGFLLVDGYSVLGEATNLEDTLSAVIEETTTLGDSFEEHSPVGVKAYELSQQGFYNDEANGSNAALIDAGGEKVLSWAPAGNVIGRRFIGAIGVQVNYVRLIARAALHKANAMYRSAGGAEPGIILHALGEETAASGDTEDGSSQDAGALSSNGGAGYLQVTALDLDGYDDITVKVRHSDDDITYADLVSFTAVTAAPAAERKTVTGTVNRHLAHSWAFTGAGTAPSATYMVGFARS